MLMGLSMPIEKYPLPMYREYGAVVKLASGKMVKAQWLEELSDQVVKAR